LRRGGGAAAAAALVALLGQASPSPARAEAEPPPSGASSPAGTPFTIEVVTFGPGDHPFTRFGHDGIRVIDHATHEDRVFNFGTFSIEAHGLILDFLRGRLRYWLSESPTADTMAAYRRENRSITAQTLELSADEQTLLVHRLEANARPENREYRYDYFYDNCSTRVRDVLDGVSGGAVRAAVTSAPPSTLRQQALRMAADDRGLYVALLVVLGPSADRPIDAWTAEFLPQILERALRAARRKDASGMSRPLVANERVIFAARRAPPRAEAPRWAGLFFAAGLSLGLFFVVLGRLGRRLVVARLVFGFALGAAGALLGFVGAFLLSAWALTPHAVVYRNQNILLLAPFTLALAVLGLGVAMGRPGATTKALFVTAAALVLAVAAAVVKLLPVAPQDNAALIAMVLPLWLGMTVGIAALRRA